MGFPWDFCLWQRFDVSKEGVSIVSFQISKANDHGTHMRTTFSSHVPWASSGPTADEAADVYMNLNAQNRPMKQFPWDFHGISPGLKVTLESRICALGPGGRLAVALLLGPLKGKARGARRSGGHGENEREK